MKLNTNVFLLILLSGLLIGCTTPTPHSSNAEKQSRINNKEIGAIVKTFFEKYKEEPATAVDYLSSTNASISDTQVGDVKLKLDSTISLLGKFMGYSQINERNVSDDLILCSYMLKYERQPIRFTFIFYKPGDKWIIQKYKFDSEVITELEESDKIYLME